MKKIIWQNLLRHAKTFFNEAAQTHLRLLETFLTHTEVYTFTNHRFIEFHELTNFTEKQGVSKTSLLDGPAAKLFRALDDQIPEQTLCFDVDHHTVIYHFKDKTCTEIYNIEIDLDSYTLVKKLGAGTNSTVQLFQNSQRKVIALKTPNPAIPHNGYIVSRKRDIEIAKQLYPEDGLYWINEHTRQLTDSNGKMVSAYGFYVVIPYIHGENFAAFCSKLNTKAELLNTFTAVSLELQRLHSLLIIHGDINANNILLWHDPKTKKVSVRFIDFEWSYYRYSEKAPMTREPTLHWPPERIMFSETIPDFIDESFEKEKPDSHPNQDLFSFGHMILSSLNSHPLIHSLHSVKKYCDQFLQKDPGKRPTLESFISELDQEKKRETNSTRGEETQSNSSTGYLMRLGIAGKENALYDNFFGVETNATSAPKKQTQPVTDKMFGLLTINQNYFKAPATSNEAPLPHKSISYG